MERPSVSPPRTPPLKEIYIKNTSSHIGLAIGLSICITGTCNGLSQGIVPRSKYHIVSFIKPRLGIGN